MQQFATRQRIRYSLVRPGIADLKKSFRAYSDNLTKLDRDGKNTLKRVEDMRQHSQEYFPAGGPQLRALSFEERRRLAESCARVPVAGEAIKGAYRTYLTNLKEIQLFLSNDLTPRGIESIDPAAKKTVQEREALQASFGPVLSALDEIKAELSNDKQ